MRRGILITIIFFLLLIAGGEASAFVGGGCGEGECRDCHSLDKREAEGMLKKWVDNVISVEYAEVPGLYVVEVEKQGKNYPLYIDFSKSYLISGSIVRLGSGENVTRELYNKYNKVDLSTIPLDDALVLGKRDAPSKIVVFTDPQCPYCKKMHDEFLKVVKTNPEISFYIKLYPLKMHPDAYRISKSIVCKKSMGMLEDSFENRPVPDPSCETKVVDETLALVKKLGINSTPTMILPSGTIVPGYMAADKIVTIIRNDKMAQSSKK